MAASPDVWTDVDLTFTQLRALFILGRQPLRVSDLAKALGMSLASASALSDRLVRQGLVARHPDPTTARPGFLLLPHSGRPGLRRWDGPQQSRRPRGVRQWS